jgi:CRP/FNR family cyclic AMP-dependent transcriptional regulator
MDTDELAAIHEVLGRGRWFGSLPPLLRTRIVELSVTRRWPRGAYIVRQGEPGKGDHGVLEGRVRLVCQVGDGQEALLHVGEAGFWCGGYGLLTGAPSVGSVVADSSVRTRFLPIAAFEQIVEEEPHWYPAFVALLCDRYARLFRSFAESRALPVEEWLLSRLQDLAAMRRGEGAPLGPVMITVSQADLATMIGVTRQTLGGMLARLETRGLIEVGFRHIRVLG